MARVREKKRKNQEKKRKRNKVSAKLVKERVSSLREEERKKTRGRR